MQVRKPPEDIRELYHVIPQQGWDPETQGQHMANLKFAYDARVWDVPVESETCLGSES